MKKTTKLYEGKAKIVYETEDKDTLIISYKDSATAFNGEDGLRLAKEIMPDLIILDVMMPKINGYKISRLLKYDNKYKDIPIIMVTARSQMEDKMIGEETGVNEYITKPFELDTIVKKVEEYLGDK